jgi:hypothetical protein
MPPIDGTDFSQLQTLISLLSQMGGGVNPTLMASAYPANVSPAGVKSSFSPEILLASGLVSPETLNQLTAGELRNLQTKYASSIQSQLPPEASDIALYPITSKYMGTDELSDFMRSTLDAIGSGKVTPAQALTKIQTDANVPKIVLDNLGQVSDDIDKFVELVGRRDFAKAKFEYEQQGKIGAAGPAPTAESARLALFDKLGVPQMALLGDPNATYQFDPSGFVDKQKMAGYNTALQQAMMGLDAARGNTAGAIQQGKLAESYAGRAIQEQARLAGDRAAAGMQQGPTTGDIAKSVLGAAIPFYGGPLNFRKGLQSKQDELNTAMDAARQAAYAQELARLKADLPPTSDEASRIKYSPEYRTAKAKVTKAKAGASLENAYGRLVSEALEKELVNRGITPYSQNVNDLLGYSIRTSKK